MRLVGATTQPDLKAVALAQDVQTIGDTLRAARAGGATTQQLFDAYCLAEKHQLSSSVAELRNHIRKHIPDPNMRRTIGLSLLIGVCSGIVTHLLLKVSGER